MILEPKTLWDVADTGVDIDLPFGDLSRLSSDAAMYLDTVSLLETHITLFSSTSKNQIGIRWLQHAAGHLLNRLDASFREHPPFPTSEQAALAMVQDIARELQAAASALDTAASALKNLPGCGLQANRTKQAATRARETAQGLVQA